MNRFARVSIALVSVVFVLAEAAPALAFDRGPHTDITRDAMAAEGFGGDAVGVAQVENWFVDLYHELSAEKQPYGGHGGFWKRVLVGAGRSEDWPQSVVSASTRMHFDDNPGTPMEGRRPDLGNTAGITAEWDRLRRAVWTLVQEARERNDPEELLDVLGMSLHPVQDFEAHTNWIEPLPGHGPPGSDGPGWQERGFGSNPTWFDVPAADRNAVNIYGDSTPGHARIHGLWNADGNRSLTTAMNKDWPGRPLFLQAYTTAYFASRQWIEAVREWVNDPAFWAEAENYRANQSELDHDLAGMHEIMLWSGHWQGQGEPRGGLAHGVGGSLPDLVKAVRNYFQPGLDPFGPLHDKTRYRARYETLIERMADRNPTGELGPVPSSQPLQRATKFVVLRVLKMRGEGLGDPGPDQADMYARVGIDGQTMSSAVIHGHDSFDFPKPYAPFTFVKAVPSAPSEPEPVESIEVEVKTANVRWAGTDDDVYLRLSPHLRFPLDKRLYNDFERSDHDTYSVPIDALVEAGLRVGDITEVKIEKSRDGFSGGWKLGGVKLRVNGQVAYENFRVNRWLEDNHRTWTAPDFEPRDPGGAKVPVWVNLRESDSLYGGDDEGDINPFDNRNISSLGYAPGAPFWWETRGENKLGGRLGYGGDGARIDYSLETITPEPMTTVTLPPPPPPAPKPDLVITDFTATTITVENDGEAAAGDFRINISNPDTFTQFQFFSGLAPGQSEQRRISGLSCEEGPYLATVDDNEIVDESDETNNTQRLGTVIC